jgi:hypothetical protein
MPDIPVDTHAQILNELDGTRLDVVGLRDTTDVKAGYKGFDLAETTLLNCRSAIEALRDRDQIVSMLKRGNVVLREVGGGDAWPAVQRARTALQNLWERLSD